MSFVNIEVKYEEKWTIFYPLQTPVIMDDEIKYLTKETFEKEKEKGIYGKLCCGYVGYNPAWMYGTFNSNNLRIKPK